METLKDTETSLLRPASRSEPPQQKCETQSNQKKGKGEKKKKENFTPSTDTETATTPSHTRTNTVTFDMPRLRTISKSMKKKTAYFPFPICRGNVEGAV